MIAKKKVCIVVSSPMTILAFLNDQIRTLSTHYDVTVVLNLVVDQEWYDRFPSVNFINVAIERKIALVPDLAALFCLLKLFRKEDYVIVHSVTPKAGLLAMTAARLAGVTNRLHTFTGQVWATRSGFSRLLLKTLDRVLVAMTSRALVDSLSQRAFLTQEGVLKEGQAVVLGNGSISGVDTGKFKPDLHARQSVRNELKIPEHEVVFLFLGRLNRDKGVLDLAKAFSRYHHSGLSGHLLLVGPDEEELFPEIEALFEHCQEQLHYVPWTDNPQIYMTAADVFCLPSYREGFGSVIIEAASCGIPSIGTRIYGITDAIVAGETGLFCEPRDVDQLAECLALLARDDQLRREMGSKAQIRAKGQFSKETLSQALLDFYHELLA